MSNTQSPVSYITITGLPDTESKFPPDKIVNIIKDFQQQHYTDHSTIYSVINTLQKNLNIPIMKTPLPNLFFSDAQSFNDFLMNNRSDHAVFYKSTLQIAQALIDQGYGVTPTLINFNENILQSAANFDYLTINRFIQQEVVIHNAFMRYLDILLDTMSRTPIPSAGGD
jgi:hypothetical protein